MSEMTLSLSVKEIMMLLGAIGVLGIGYLIRELGRCADESAQLEEDSMDEVTQREDWQK